MPHLLKLHLNDRIPKLKFHRSHVKEKKFSLASKLSRTFTQNTRISWYSYTNIYFLIKKAKKAIKEKEKFLSCHVPGSLDKKTQCSRGWHGYFFFFTVKMISSIIKDLLFNQKKMIWKKADYTESFGSNQLRVIRRNFISKT